MSIPVSVDTRPTEALRQAGLTGGGISVASRMVNYVIQMGSTVVLARLLKPEDFGLVAMVYAFVAVFLVFQDFGLVDAVIQEPVLHEKQIANAFWVTLALSVLVAMLVAAGSPLVGRFFDDPRLTLITVVYASCFPLIGGSVLHLALLKRQMRFGRVALVETCATVISVGTAIGLAVAGMGYWAIVGRPVVLAASRTAGAWIASGWRPTLPDRHHRIGSLLRFGASSSGYFLTNYLARNIDKILIGRRYGAADLGFYDRAFQLFLLPIGQLTIPLHHVAVSTLSRLREDPAQLRRWFLRALRLMGFTGFGICLFLVAVSNEVVTLLLGSQWDRTARIFTVLGVGGTMQLLYTSCGWLHSALGKAHRWFRWGVVAAALTTIGVAAGLPFGAEGVALAYTIVLFVITLPALLYAGSPIHLRGVEVLSAVWRYLLAAATAAAGTRAIVNALPWSPAPAIRLSVAGITFPAFYLGVALALYGGPSEIFRDMSTALSVFHRRTKL